jgi:hypothetical protein
MTFDILVDPNQRSNLLMEIQLFSFVRWLWIQQRSILNCSTYLSYYHTTAIVVSKSVSQKKKKRYLYFPDCLA